MHDIAKQVSEVKKTALTHSLNCEQLIVSGGLKAALDYAANQGIKPPECSLEAQSANADKMRTTASRMLCESKWWARRLKNQAVRHVEQEQTNQGKVTNFISDEMLKYQGAN